MARAYDWHFPLPRTHAGVLQGNGTFGAMIWGQGNQLNLTLARADFWDHRGGKPWSADMTFANIRRLLEAGDEKALRAIFEQGDVPPGHPRRPSVLPLGRLELIFDAGTTLSRATLDLDTAELTIHLTARDGQEHKAAITLSMDASLLHVDLPEELGLPTIHCVPSWEYVGDYLQTISFKPPEAFEQATVSARMEEGMEEPPLTEDVILSGWVQERPADDPICVGYRIAAHDLWIGVVYGKDPLAAQRNAANLLDRSAAAGLQQLRDRNVAWWSSYWSSVPRIDIPNERLAFIYTYGMYKFAGLTNPAGVPATLQGPWIEEYQMPPWSSDYHFNINVQMCYWPAYQGNRLSHLRPMFEMVWSWRDKLRENARLFVGIDDGYLLPHSVDDRGVIMGGFWTGTIDHACTAWIARMMYDYYRYTGDQEFLRTRAYPFMLGAMRVYEQMLEKKRDGSSFLLPVSVSPEYRGAAMNAWGRNASFQLGCIHTLIEALLESCKVLNETPRPIWTEIQQGLPKACVQDHAGRPMIMLWEGTPLEESHRHHSHLAGLYPWDVIEPTDPQWKAILDHSYTWWNRQGMGLWSGWCVPWAAMLHARIGSPELSEATLEYWQRLFTNEGHGTLHDPRFFKRNVHDAPKNPKGWEGSWRGEVMQIEAGMAAAAAVLDGLVHVRRGVHWLFQGAPLTWRSVGFEKIRTEGGFLVSARRHQNLVERIHVTSDLGNTFRLANPWSASATVIRPTGTTQITGPILELPTHPGEAIELIPGPDVKPTEASCPRYHW